MKEDFLWVEKYRPRNISDCILPTETKKIFQDFVNNKDTGPLGSFMENFAIFVNVVNLTCGILTSIGLFSLYVITRFEIYLTIPTYGFGGVLGALRRGERARERPQRRHARRLLPGLLPLGVGSDSPPGVRGAERGLHPEARRQHPEGLRDEPQHHHLLLRLLLPLRIRGE